MVKIIRDAMLLEAILQTCDHGILVVDEDRQIILYNRCFCELWGISESVMENNNDNQTVESVLSQLEDSGCFLSRLDYLYKHQEEQGKDEIMLLDGRVFYRFTAPLFGCDEEYFGRIWCFSDVTERKNIERSRIETERLCAIGEMSAGVAHDYNNALQAILGNLDLAILTPNVPADALEFIKTAIKSTGDAAVRVQQLRRFSRVSKTEKCALFLNELLEEVILQARPIWSGEVEKKGLQVSFQKCYGNIPSIDGNEGEIDSVLFNIIKNAVEAMPNGGQITIETGLINGQVKIAITDSGMGMSEETRKRIFQPFFSTKGFEPGRGMGMSAVYSIIRDHQAEINVKTAVSKGTTVELLFPIGVIVKQAEIKSDPKSKGSIALRILLVDDEESIRDVFGQALQKFGYIIDVVSSGQAALESLDRQKYDLMITDIGMPGMNGWQLADKVRGRYGDMKVAIVSGWGDEHLPETLRDKGVDYCWCKPITINELDRLIKQAFEIKA